MFARIVSMRLKPSTQAEFTQKIEKEIVPTLRRQQGFKDEIVFVVPNGTEAVAISLWESRENAETYNRATYPEVHKTLTNLVEGTPEVRTFEVGYSTFHKIAARAAA
ncbi:MAG: antibiotic biosynthesis monooxygenase [Terriglobales bacterium]